MRVTIINSTMWWLTSLSIAQLAEAANNTNSNSSEGLSKGQIAVITLCSLGAAVVALAVTASCLSCCSTKTTKTTKTNADGSNETIETNERGSQKVAMKIVDVASNVSEKIGNVLSIITHTSEITIANTHQKIPSSPNPVEARYKSTASVTSIDSEIVLLAIKKDIADGPSDGNIIAAEGLMLLKARETLAQATFLIAEDAKLHHGQVKNEATDKPHENVQATGLITDLSTEHMT